MELSVNNLNLKYDIQVLSNISFKLNNNTIMAIAGKNGSGKTSLIESIFGIRNANGKILFNNKNIRNNIEFKNKTGIISNDFPFIYDLSLLYNLKYFLLINKINITNNEIDNALSKFNLLKHKNRKMGILSNGMKIKFQIMYNYLKKPELLFMDEPTAFLDIDSQNYIVNLIKDIKNNNSFFKSCIMATHNMDLIKMSDDILLLSDGKIIEHNNFNYIINEFKNKYVVIADKYINLLNNINYNETSNNRLIIKIDDYNKLSKKPDVLEINYGDIFGE